jgi:hypothetical protein
MFPHERSLVENLKDEPFVVLGINGDDGDLQKARQRCREENITWRSFQNSPADAKTSIAQQWNVRGWPTLYLVDAKGTIRNRWLGNPGDKVLDGEIAGLIKEAKGTPVPAGAE